MRIIIIYHLCPPPGAAGRAGGGGDCAGGPEAAGRAAGRAAARLLFQDGRRGGGGAPGCNMRRVAQLWVGCTIPHHLDRRGTRFICQAGTTPQEVKIFLPALRARIWQVRQSFCSKVPQMVF